MDETGSQDPFLRPYNPFSHPLAWCLRDYLGTAGGVAESSNLQDTFVKSQDLQAAAKVKAVAAL